MPEIYQVRNLKNILTGHMLKCSDGEIVGLSYKDSLAYRLGTVTLEQLDKQYNHSKDCQRG